jgi:hypothetical protein
VNVNRSATERFNFVDDWEHESVTKPQPPPPPQLSIPETQITPANRFKPSGCTSQHFLYLCSQTNATETDLLGATPLPSSRPSQEPRLLHALHTNHASCTPFTSAPLKRPTPLQDSHLYKTRTAATTSSRHLYRLRADQRLNHNLSTAGVIAGVVLLRYPLAATSRTKPSRAKQI